MRTRISYLLTALVSLAGVIHSSAQGTAFTYQGRLNNGANPANGKYDLAFSLFSVVSGAEPIGTTFFSFPITNYATLVTNGMFTVTLDFGPGIFPGGNDRWLELGVRTNGAAGFTTLVPRQMLTPTPYAIYSASAGSAGSAITATMANMLLGTLPASQLNGTLSSSVLSGTYSGALTLNNPANGFTGDGANLTSVNAATLNGLTSASFWNANGNAGAPMRVVNWK